MFLRKGNPHLERQIVGTTLARRFLCRREGRGGSIGCRWEGRGSWSDTSHRGNTGYWRHLTAHDIIGTDLVEPTSIVLVGINVKLNRDIFAILNVKLLDAVLAENTEDTLTGILTWHLDDILL